MDATTPQRGRRQTAARLAYRQLASTTPVTGIIERKALIVLAKALPRAGLASAKEVLLLQLLLASVPTTNFGPGGRPLVFKSNRELAYELNCTPETVSRLLSRLFDRGLVAMQDSGNYKRYAGYGLESDGCGIDLRVLIARYDELVATITDHEQAHRLRKAAERRYRGAIRAVQSWLHETSSAVVDSARTLISRIQRVRQAVEGAGMDGSALERGARLVERLVARALNVSSKQNESCLHDETVIQIQTTSPENTLSCNDKRRSANAERPKHRPGFAGQEAFEKSQPAPSVLVNLNVTDIWNALPDLAQYGFAEPRNWQEMTALAGPLCRLSGISDDARRGAVAVMGERAAAVAIGLTVQKHITADVRSPGGYLRALTERATAGTLSLNRSVFGLLARAQMSVG